MHMYTSGTVCPYSNFWDGPIYIEQHPSYLSKPKTLFATVTCNQPILGKWHSSTTKLKRAKMHTKNISQDNISTWSTTYTRISLYPRHYMDITNFLSNVVIEGRVINGLQWWRLKDPSRTQQRTQSSKSRCFGRAYESHGASAEWNNSRCGSQIWNMSCKLSINLPAWRWWYSLHFLDTALCMVGVVIGCVVSHYTSFVLRTRSDLTDRNIKKCYLTSKIEFVKHKQGNTHRQKKTKSLKQVQDSS